MVAAITIEAMTGAWRSGAIPVAGGSIAYRRTGTGPTLVLSHGLTDNGLCWGRAVAALAGDFDMVMLDARGHGDSSRIPAEGHDPAADIGAAIEHLCLEAPILMGHSVGALATAAFACRFPTSTSRIILEDPPLLPPASQAEIVARRERFRHEVARIQALSDAEIADWGRKASPDWHEDDVPAWVQGKRQVDPEAMPIAATAWQDVIAAIAVPTLLVSGEAPRGSMVSPAAAAEAMRINPRVRAVTVGGAGHNVRRDNLPGFLAAIRPFLAASDVHDQ